MAHQIDAASRSLSRVRIGSNTMTGSGSFAGVAPSSPLSDNDVIGSWISNLTDTTFLPPAPQVALPVSWMETFHSDKTYTAHNTGEGLESPASIASVGGYESPTRRGVWKIVNGQLVVCAYDYYYSPNDQKGNFVMPMSNADNALHSWSNDKGIIDRFIRVYNKQAVTAPFAGCSTTGLKLVYKKTLWWDGTSSTGPLALNHTADQTGLEFAGLPPTILSGAAVPLFVLSKMEVPPMSYILEDSF
jgi:hypothetical protein